MSSVSFVSLGCSKNLVDTEVMMGVLKSNFFSLVDDPENADVIVVNTCGFISDAKKESIEAILQCAKLKGTDKKLIVAGCLSQRYKKDLAKDIPEVDLFIGTKDFHRIAEYCSKLLGNEKQESKADSTNSFLYNHNTPRLITTGKSSAYVKISEGCNNRCSYCAIPLIRGNLQSRPISSVLTEVQALADAGVLEINLLAQDITSYGRDFAHHSLLPELLREMAKISGIEWIRILYAHPEGLTDELIETIAAHEKICNYIDIPVQHSHPEILSRMNRKASINLVRPMLERIRAKLANVAIRTTLLVGCPGEDEKHFEHLLDFVKWAEFDRLGVFEYSTEEDTAMGDMQDTVQDDIKLERKEMLMEVQADISYAKNKEMVGKVYDVLIEEESDSGYLEGRTRFHAPEVDGSVMLNAAEISDQQLEHLKPGKIIPVKITKADIYDLVGVPAAR